MAPLAQQDGTGYAKPARRSSSLAAEPPLASKAARGGSSPTSVAKKHGPDSQRASCKLTEAMKNPNWRDRGPDGGSSSSANVSTDESHALGLSSAGSRRWGWVSSSSGDSYVIVEPDNINNRKISPADRRYHARQSVDAPPPSPASTWVPGQHDGEPDANGLLEILVQLKLDDSSAEDSGLFVFEVADRDQSISAAKATGNSSNSCVRIERGPISLVPTQAEQGGPSRFYTSVARELGINGAHRANVSGHTGAKEPHRGRSSHYRAGNGGIFQGVPGTDRARHSMRSSGLSSSYTTRTTDASTSQSNASETHLSPQHRPTSGNLILPNVRDSNLNVCLPRAEDEARAGLDAKNEAFQRMLNKLKKPAQTRLPMQGLGNIDHRISPGHGAVIQERSRLTHHDSGQDDGSVSAVRREWTVSDFNVSYGRTRSSMHQVERSSDSTNTTSSAGRYNSLNPRAREFLSFKNQNRPSLLRGSQTSSQLSSGSAESRANRIDTPSETGGWGGAAPVAVKPAPTHESLSRPYERVLPAQNLDLNRVADVRNLIPIQPRVGLPYPLVPPVNVAAYQPEPTPLIELSQILPTMYTGAGVFAHPAPGSNTYPVPPSAFRSLPSRLQYPAVSGTLQQPLHIPNPAARPAPVPKPQAPNARDQQAYEAYIEQRKAMEPGYAMECRQRQLRRAKRNQPTRVCAK